MTIPKLTFGRSGHLSTRTVFGAAALGSVSQDDADKTMELLLEYGINHIDTAASYGESELRLGPWMKTHREQFFLATKTGERTYDSAKAEFENSLKRLQVDSVDLIQLHYLVTEEDWEITMSPDGALKYLEEAREQGLVKYIGVTGHDVAIAKMHRKSLERFDFDSVLLPYNYPMMQNEIYAEGFAEVLRLSKERNVAVQTIKGITRRPYLGDTHSHATWYEPLSDQASIDLAVHWVLGQDGVFLNTAGDIDLLPKILDAASRFETRPSEKTMQNLVQQQQMQALFV